VGTRVYQNENRLAYGIILIDSPFPRYANMMHGLGDDWRLQSARVLPIGITHPSYISHPLQDGRRTEMSDMATKTELIQQEMGKLKDVTMEPLKQASMAVSSYFPQIMGALTILITGWLVALLLRKMTGKALRALGLDIVLERIGITHILQRSSIHKRPSELMGWLLYWLILFSTLMATFNVLGLSVASVLLQSIVAYIPHLLTALLLLGLGFFASRYIDTMATATASAFDLPVPDAWGRAAQGLIVFITAVITMSELGISTRIVNFSFLVVLAVSGMAAAIAFGLGTRRIIEQFAAGQSLRQWLHPGDLINYDPYVGTIETIGHTHVTIQTSQGIVAIPTTVILSATVIKPIQDAPPPVTSSALVSHQNLTSRKVR
jgi:small-conductance mechanosensitive channel